MINQRNSSNEDTYDDPLTLDLYNHLVHLDNEGLLRKSIAPAKGLTASFLLKYVKSCIGTDLSRIIAPVNFNEPLTVLQKTAEITVGGGGYL